MVGHHAELAPGAKAGPDTSGVIPEPGAGLLKYYIDNIVILWL